MTSIRPAPMSHPHKWTESSAEACVHFLQINYRLHSSRWAQCWGPSGSCPEPLPDIEALTLPLLLIRQVVSCKDQLFLTVTQAYRECLPDSLHSKTIDEEYKGFLAKLNENAATLQCCTVRELLDALMYGTFLFHAPKNVKTGPREVISRLQTKDNTDVLHDLDYAIKSVWHHIDNTAVIVYADLSSWIRAGIIQKPGVCMLDNIFRIEDIANKWIQEIL